MTTRIIGIDFGTSSTVVCVHNVGADNRIAPLAVNGSRTIPTIAFKTKDAGEMYYGFDAFAKSESNAEGTLYRNFKMDLISNDEAQRSQAESLIQGFLRYVYDQYVELLNGNAFDPADETKVYVSHPAKWNSYARTLMKQSVERAGFCKQENIVLKDEPTAAFLAAIHEKNEELKQESMLFEGRKYKAMMIDMGAGTTDIVLCSYKVANGQLELDDIFTYPSINAPGLCGGREIDEAIVAEAEQFVNRMQAKPTATGERVIRKFRLNVKKWKELTLSKALESGKDLPEPDEISGFRDSLSDFGVPIMNEGEKFSFSRERFETLTQKHWTQWVELLQGAFDEVKGEQYANLNCPKSPEEVELLIATGGHSQWYIVSDYLLGKNGGLNLPMLDFAKIRANPHCLIQTENPQETVANGLCRLDEDVVGAIAASNDVSIKFSCEGKHLGDCVLIRKGVPLPFEKKDFEIINTIKGNFIYRKALNVDYSIVTDKDNVVNRSVTVPSDGIIGTVIKAGAAGLGLAFTTVFKLIASVIKGNFSEFDGSMIDEIANTDYTVNLSPDIYVNEEGIIKVGGTIVIDDEKAEIPEIII